MTVFQDWVGDLTLMMQSVLIAAVRGPDGLPKDHVAKLMLRWYRRCILISAFDQVPLFNPSDPRGGSFTGPSVKESDCVAGDWASAMSKVLDKYLSRVDEIPHHFQLHFMHAAEILGYYHPDSEIRMWWYVVYRRLADDMHLNPESKEVLSRRLGDNERNWRLAEEVAAKGPYGD